MTSACSNQCIIMELSLDRRCTAPLSLVHLLCNLEITSVPNNKETNIMVCSQHPTSIFGMLESKY